MTFDWFKNNGIFIPMINDTGRNVFYKNAIEQSVRDKVVVDIGTGTGLLSVLAAKAGARKVFAVEIDQGRAEYARNVFAEVGVDVEVVNADFLTTDIPADIYVSETIGSQIFNENIIAISDHARKYGGQFIPGRFEITAVVYENHPIFPLVQSKSDAFEFQPDIMIDATFENLVNSSFQQQHPLADTLYRANCIHGLFSMLPRFNDLKLTKLYATDPITVDLNQQVDINDIKLIIPNSVVGVDKQVCVVLFWLAKFDNLVMNVTDTIWGNPSKIILPRCRKDQDIVTWYDPNIGDWRFSF
jgi:predicted RNA methylase